MSTWLQRYRLHRWARSSLGIIPIGFVLGAIALSLLLPWIDEQVTKESPFVYSASSAQSMLSAIAAGMITFTGFVFSILTFAIQFGASTYTTRLMRIIVADNLTKVALGVFVATFTYALLVLAKVAPTEVGYVPQYSVLFAILLVLASVVVFLRLITTFTQELRTGTISARVGMNGRRMIETTFPYTAVSPEETAEDFRPDESTVREVRNLRSGGVIQAINFYSIATIASEAGAVIELIPAVGEYVPSGAAVFRVYAEEQPVNDQRLLHSVALGYERTFKHDLEYPLRILVDIAIKALSPAINDPTTAVQALDEIENLILLLGSRQLSGGLIRDSQNRVRFIYSIPTWEEYLSLAFTEIREFGSESSQVMERLRTILNRVRAIVPEWRFAAIDKQLKLLDETTLGRRRT